MEMGVSGADAVSREIVAAGGDKNGGWMIGNIICSPDASAGTLLAACGYWMCGILGGITAIILVFIGARICADKGFAGISGAIFATLTIWALNIFVGFPPESFIAGMIIAIFLLQGVSVSHASRIIGNLWRKI
jgi:energy-converting hydrogenase A subunit B